MYSKKERQFLTLFRCWLTIERKENLSLRNIQHMAMFLEKELCFFFKDEFVIKEEIAGTNRVNLIDLDFIGQDLGVVGNLMAIPIICLGNGLTIEFWTHASSPWTFKSYQCPRNNKEEKRVLFCKIFLNDFQGPR